MDGLAKRLLLRIGKTAGGIRAQRKKEIASLYSLLKNLAWYVKRC